MDIARFKESLIPTLFGSDGDGPFSTFRILLHGMSGVRTAKLLNLACLCADKGEFYLEVGTFTGYTLVSASYQTNTTCLGVDDLSMDEVIRKDISEEERNKVLNAIRGQLSMNMQNYGSDGCKFIETDFRKVTLNSDAIGKMCCLFIDGNHNYQEVKETLEKFEPYLTKDAVVIIDDVQMGGVPKYINEISSKYELLFYGIATITEHDRKVHAGMSLNNLIANGICVLRKLDA